MDKYTFDAQDQERLDSIQVQREAIQGPRIGDYLLFPTGQLERFSHDWGNQLQTSEAGSIYLCSNGNGSFSGSLNPSTPLDAMTLTSAKLPGEYWFFHHGFSGAGRGVRFQIPCRVYTTTAKYEGFSKIEHAPKTHSKLKAQLQEQLDIVEAT